jgi:hypothetical protein
MMLLFMSVTEYGFMQIYGELLIPHLHDVVKDAVHDVHMLVQLIRQ